MHTSISSHTILERERLDHIKSLQERLERGKLDLEIAQREGKYEQASRLRYSTIPELEAELGRATPPEGGIHDRVTADDIARVVARATGVPVQNLLKGERDRLMHVSPFYSHYQWSKTDRWCRWMRPYAGALWARIMSSTPSPMRSGCQEQVFSRRTGPWPRSCSLDPPELARPSFAKRSRASCSMTSPGDCKCRHFLNPHVCVTFSRITINMSEFHDRHTISRLIGAAPGYVGFEEGVSCFMSIHYALFIYRLRVNSPRLFAGSHMPSSSSTSLRRRTRTWR
jgi:ATP-dependent Clp protease ATP-binding subunit ClpB